MSVAVLDTALFNPLGRLDRRPFPKPRVALAALESRPLQDLWVLHPNEWFIQPATSLRVPS